jgi:hypothetical protein
LERNRLVNEPETLLSLLVTRGRVPSTRAKDIKTALRRLADATQTPVKDLDLLALERTYEETLKAYFLQCDPPPSSHTQRNVLQNLRQLYHLLFDNGLLTPSRSTVLKRPNRRQVIGDARATSPYRHRTIAALPRYYRPLETWPDAIRQPFEAFCLDRTFRVRQSTQDNYRNHMTAYVSYGLTHDPLPLTTWNQLFEPARLTRFITWHAKRVGAGRVSTMGLQVARLMRAIANTTERPEAAALQTFVVELPAVKPLHDKQAPYHTISAGELESVGLALLTKSRQPLRGDAPSYNKRPGLLRATAHQTGLILRLLWRVPLRSRNIREMELGKNLFRNTHGVWQLRFAGDELKVGQRRGRLNTFQVPWPDELVSHLDEYLTVHRPRLPHADTCPLVFPSRQGGKATHQAFYLRLSDTVYMHLRKRLYPHLMRSLWVDRWLLNGGDVSTGAFMLNDSVQTVLQRYHELRGLDHVEKAYAFNRAILGHGKGTSRSPLV